MENKGLLIRLGDKWGIEPSKVINAVVKTCFPKDATQEQLLAFFVVCEKYNLNPFLKEIYAFPSKDGGIVPMVGLDGWVRIVNDHPAFDGLSFNYCPNGDWVECEIFRKDRSRPTVAREYLTECKRNSMPWNSSPKRMLRHRAFIQAARLAFGFSGFSDDPLEGEDSFDPISITSTVTQGEKNNSLRDALENKNFVQVEVNETVATA